MRNRADNTAAHRNIFRITRSKGLPQHAVDAPRLSDSKRCAPWFLSALVADRSFAPNSAAMIYNTESSLFQSFLSSGKHKPTSDEVIDALNVIKAETPNRSPEQMAATLRAKYPQWVLEDLDWAELSRKMGDDD